MIKKIHHVGIVVRDLDQAYGFYRDTLGLCISKEDTIPDQGVRAALMPIGHSEIELLQPIQEGTGIAKFLESRGEGMHHLCFETDNIDRELDGLKAKDTLLIDQNARSGLAGRIAFVHPKCTHRTLIELATPPEAHDAPHKAHGEAQAQDLDRVTLAVPDTDAAATDYGTLFGLRGEPFDVSEAGGRGHMLAVGHAYIELLMSTDSDGRVGKLIAEAGEGIIALTIRVALLDSAIAHLRSKGAQSSEAMPGPRPGDRSAWVDPSSTHGVRLRLLER